MHVLILVVAMVIGSHLISKPQYYRRRLAELGNIPCWVIRIVGVFVIVVTIYGSYVRLTGSE